MAIENLNEINANMRSSFVSPIYTIKKIKVSDICGQSSNPNSMSGKSYSALQRSIFNTGYGMNIVGAPNPIYDSEFATKLTDLQRINLCIEGSEEDARSAIGSDNQFATQLSDDSLRRAFKYQVVDGSQRSSIVRLGTKFFLEDNNALEKAENWMQGKNIPEDPGREMLKYLAWREDFSIPVAVLEGKSDAEMMSSTILFNTARGSHSLDSMKDIVANLINVANMSEEWVAKNLFLDLDSVKRMVQLSGLKSAFSAIDSANLSWNPVDDNSYERKMNAYLNREAAKYVQNYLNSHEDAKSKAREMGDILEYAESLGWSKSAAEGVFQGK